jgi:hypothetical protein
MTLALSVIILLLLKKCMEIPQKILGKMLEKMIFALISIGDGSEIRCLSLKACMKAYCKSVTGESVVITNVYS